jgi:tetratricopeptide (TPR) repeat protein
VQGDYAAAWTLTEERLALLDRLGDQSGRGRALSGQGLVALQQGNYALARALCQESLSLHQQLGDVLGAAGARNNLGYIALAQGEYEQAIYLCRRSYTDFQTAGRRGGMMAAQGNLGNAALLQGDLPAALAAYRQQLTLSREIGNVQATGEALTGLAGVAAARRQWERVARFCGAVDTLLTTTQERLVLVEQRVYDGLIRQARTALGAGRFARAWATGSTQPLAEVLAEAQELSGHPQ